MDLVISMFLNNPFLFILHRSLENLALLYLLLSCFSWWRFSYVLGVSIPLITIRILSFNLWMKYETGWSLCNYLSVGTIFFVSFSVVVSLVSLGPLLIEEIFSLYSDAFVNNIDLLMLLWTWLFPVDVLVIKFTAISIIS